MRTIAVRMRAIVGNGQDERVVTCNIEPQEAEVVLNWYERDNTHSRLNKFFLSATYGVPFTAVNATADMEADLNLFDFRIETGYYDLVLLCVYWNDAEWSGHIDTDTLRAIASE